MTTIAYRDGVMACDSSCWVDGVLQHRVQKIHRVGGGLVGFAGSIAYGLAIVEWLKDGADDDRYPKEKDGTVIIVDSRGRISALESESKTVCRIRDRFVAIGSGSAIALGAMAAVISSIRAKRPAAFGATYGMGTDAYSAERNDWTKLPPPGIDPPKTDNSNLLLLGGAAAAIAMAGTLLISPWEGRELRAYYDIVGVLTICDGDTENVRPGQVATNAECEVRLNKSVSKFEVAIRPCLPASLSTETRAAFISAAYNIGSAGFCGSSMSRHAKAGRMVEACNALMSWNKGTFSSVGAATQRVRGERCTAKANGKFLCTIKGLTNRREAERNLCLKGLAK